jgi:hypothetical protein
MASPFARALLPALLAPVACAHSAPAGPGPVAASVAVTFVVEGGIAGSSERLEVAPDGSLALFDHDRRVGTGQLAPQVLERLQGLVQSGAFRDLEPRYVPENPCCDRFSYTVRVVRTGGEQSVSTIEGADWPAPLGEAIQILSQARRVVRRE